MQLQATFVIPTRQNLQGIFQIIRATFQFATYVLKVGKN